MIEKRMDKLEDEISEIKDDVIDSKQALSSISKDIHIMSQTSMEMKNALTKLLETEVKFQLHSQETKQMQIEHARLIKVLFKRVEAIEATVKTVPADHTIVEKLSSVFWKALGWAAGIFAALVGSALLYVAKQGGLG